MNTSWLSDLRRSQSGNVFFALFGAVALVGVVGASSMQIMKGPVRSMAEVTKRTVAENNMIASSKLALIAATSQANNGDCDSDNFVEAIPFEDAGAGAKPTGGGYLPASIGAALNDPWDTRYGYCAWNHGTTLTGGGCPTAGYLAGVNSNSGYAIAVISAGPDRTFNTTCSAYPSATPLNKAAGSDDVVLGYTYAEAEANSGGLWNLQSGDPDTAEIAKNLEVKNSGGTTTFALDAQTGIGDFLGITTGAISAKTSKIDITGGLKLDTGSVLTGACTDAHTLKYDTTAGTIIRCNGSNWVSAGGDNLGNHIATQNIQLGAYWLSGDGGNEGIKVDASGNVGVGKGTPAYRLDVDGTIASSGSSGLIAMFNDSAIVSAINANTGARLDLRSGNLPILTAATTGNVGIGTTNPQANLDVTAADNFSFIRINPDANASAYGATLSNNDVGLNFNLNSAIRGFTFSRDGTTDMAISPAGYAGNVGIGTTTPANKLHVANLSGALAMDMQHGGGTHNAGIRFRDEAGNNKWYIANYGDSNTYPNAFGIYQFTNTADAAVTQYRLMINDAGNVGIGTTNATSKLTVAGQVDVSSNKIINVLNPTAAQDAATKAYVDAAVAAGTGFVETDPQVGTIATSGKICQSNGTLINCDIDSSALGGDNLGNHTATMNVKFLSATGGAGVGAGTADNMGNHIATTNIRLGSNWLSGDGGNEGVYVGSTGNVGIGTATPGQLLDIGSTTANAYVYLKSPLASQSGMVLADQTNGTDWHLYRVENTRDASVWNPTVGNVMRLTQAGNVGIGTATPGAKLEVNGTQILNGGSSSNWASLNIGGAAGINAIGSIYSYDRICSSNASGTCGGAGGVVVAGAGGTANGNVFISGSGNSYFNAGGNVGVGTTAPGSALDVKGTLRLSGSTSGYVGFAPAAAAGSTTYTLPAADGISGQQLTTNGSGTLSWAAAGAAGADNLGAGGTTTGTLYSASGGYGYVGHDATDFIRFDNNSGWYWQINGVWEYYANATFFGSYTNGANDIGATGSRWKDGWFEGTLTAATGVNTAQVCNAAGSNCIAQASLGSGGTGCGATTITWGTYCSQAVAASVHAQIKILSYSGSYQGGATYQCLNGTWTSIISACAYADPSTACFDLDTRIAMADGTMKRIADIGIGEKVLSREGVNTVIGWKPATASGRKIYTINGKIRVTGDHPVLTAKGWAVISPELYGERYQGKTFAVHLADNDNALWNGGSFDAKTLHTLVVGDQIVHGKTSLEPVITITEEVVADDKTLKTLIMDGDGTMQVEGGYVFMGLDGKAQ